MTQFDQDSNGREVEVAVGEQFEIQLVENPTTGFRWRLTSDSAASVVCVSDEFRAPSAAKPGQPGLHAWSFRCDAAGESDIKLVNARAGSTADTAGRSYTLRVRARA